MRSFLRKFLPFFVAAGVFSFFINMLLLAPSLYMLQTYDRVLSSRSLETLYMLTLLLGVLLLSMSALEMVRSRLLVKANTAIDNMLAPYLLDKMIAGATSPEGNKYSYGLKDLNSLKSFLGGQGIFALFDAPWLPVYMFILYLMDPLLVVVASIGAAIMLLLTVLTEYLSRKPLYDANTTSRLASNYVTAALRNAEAVNAMGMLANLTRRWASLNSLTLNLQNKASNRAGAVSGVTKFVRQFLQSVILGVGAYLVLQNKGFTPGLMIMGPS
jgi:ABC-type protease/lipase transport system fused ATPase/permease subunit